MSRRRWQWCQYQLLKFSPLVKDITWTLSELRPCSHLFCRRGRCGEQLVHQTLLLTLETLDNWRQQSDNLQTTCFHSTFYWQCSSIIWVQFHYHFEIQWIGWVWWPRYMGMLMVGERRVELISNQIDLNSMPWHFYWSDVEMDGRPDVSRCKQRVRGKQGWMTRKEVAGRRTWNQSIAQSVRRGPIYSNFTRECAASLPQQQSINQWKGRRPIYNLVYTAYSAFLHTASKSGVWCAGQDLLGSF